MDFAVLAIPVLEAKSSVAILDKIHPGKLKKFLSNIKTDVSLVG